jgi:hypothetical protein
LRQGTGSPYLLVYDPHETLKKQIEERKQQGYYLISTRDKGEYILKK